MIDKLTYYLERIEKINPNKTKLNVKETCGCINISTATFSRILQSNDLHKLPKFTREEYERKGKPYFRYEFSIFDIAKFLVGELNDTTDNSEN